MRKNKRESERIRENTKKKIREQNWLQEDLRETERIWENSKKKLTKYEKIQ